MPADREIRLYCFSCGTLESQKHLFTQGRGIGEPFEVPVPFFLIDHPRGKILFDTGNALAVAENAEKHWGNAILAYRPKMTTGDFVAHQLRSLEVSPDSIDFVILSHLHLDHAGGIGHFPNARYLVQRDELHWAYVPDFYQRAAYIRQDFDRPVNWMLLEGWRDDNLDLFGDGSLIIWFSPGHTPGHQSLKLQLKNTGTVILTGDSCYTEELLDEDILPGLFWSPAETIRTIQRLREARRNGAWVLTGHDPQAFSKLRLAPAFYD